MNKIKEKKSKNKDLSARNVHSNDLSNVNSFGYAEIHMLRSGMEHSTSSAQQSLLQLQRFIGNDAINKTLNVAGKSNKNQAIGYKPNQTQGSKLELQKQVQLQEDPSFSKKTKPPWREIEFNVKDFRNRPANLLVYYRYKYGDEVWGELVDDSSSEYVQVGRWYGRARLARTGKLNVKIERKTDYQNDIASSIIGQGTISFVRPDEGPLKLNVKEEKVVLFIESSSRDKAKSEAAKMLGYPQTIKVESEWLDIKSAKESRPSQYRWEIHAPSGISVTQIK